MIITPTPASTTGSISLATKVAAYAPMRRPFALLFEQTMFLHFACRWCGRFVLLCAVGNLQAKRKSHATKLSAFSQRNA